MGPSLAAAIESSNPVTFVGLMPPFPSAEATPGSQSCSAGTAAERSAASPGAERISRRDGPFLSSAVAFTTTASPRRGTDAARCAWAEIFLRSETTRTLAAATAGLEVSANMTSG